MSQNALARMAAICRAELGEFLEQIEDPKKIVAQRVRDIEECVDRAVAVLGRAAGAEQRLAKEHAANAARIVDCQRAAEGALADGDEAAARRLLLEKAQFAQRGEHLDSMLEERRRTTAQLRTQLHGLRARLEQAREREKALRLRVGGSAQAQRLAPDVESADVVRARFADIEERVGECERDVARFEEKAMVAEAEAEAWRERAMVDARTRALEELEAERSVDRQLEAMRAKANG